MPILEFHIAAEKKSLMSDKTVLHRVCIANRFLQKYSPALVDEDDDPEIEQMTVIPMVASMFGVGCLCSVSG